MLLQKYVYMMMEKKCCNMTMIDKYISIIIIVREEIKKAQNHHTYDDNKCINILFWHWLHPCNAVYVIKMWYFDIIKINCFHAPFDTFKDLFIKNKNNMLLKLLLIIV